MCDPKDIFVEPPWSLALQNKTNRLKNNGRVQRLCANTHKIKNIVENVKLVFCELKIWGLR